MNTLILSLNCIIVPVFAVYIVHNILKQMKSQQLEFTKVIIALTEKSKEYNDVFRPLETPEKKQVPKRQKAEKFSLEGMQL